MDWIPTITEGAGSVYLRIVDALSADIANGRLARGQQLPTHRGLARALDLDLTTVTRAYREARRRGLIDARVGQGTFVSETTARTAADIHYQVKTDLLSASQWTRGARSRRAQNACKRHRPKAVYLIPR